MIRRTCVVIALVCLASPFIAHAQTDGNWIVRTRIISVSPDDSSGGIGTTGSTVSVDSAIAPEVDLTLRFAQHWGLELSLFTAKHQFETQGGAIGGLDAGDAWTFSPTVCLQYHIPLDGMFSPYVGAGINYTAFYGYDLSDDMRSLGLREFDFDPSFGFVAQLGSDIALGESWSLNLDVKYIDVASDVELREEPTGLFDMVEVEVNPWVFGVGLAWSL